MWFESASEAEPPVLETETASKAQEAEGLAAVVGTNPCVRGSIWSSVCMQENSVFVIFENIYR
jgi:hypothetical protein